MDLSKLTLGDKIATACGIVLLIDLVFLPWHRVCVDFGAFGGESCGSASAIESPNGFLGILALLLTIAIVGVLIASRVGDVQLPELPIPHPAAIFYSTIAVLVLLLLKLVMETDGLGFGAWLGILLAGGMTYGGFLIFQAEGSGATPTGGGSSGPPQAF
jgi:hypothetical protein